jgi:PAS domain S-box-containing protein
MGESVQKDENRKFEVLDKLNLASIFENISDSVWAINSDYEILYTNKNFASAFYNLFGIKLKLGTNLLSSLPEPIRAFWKSKYDSALNNSSFSFIEEIKERDVTVYIEVSVNPIIIEENVIGAFFFGKDITERKLNEVALQESELLLKASLESQKDTILFSINNKYEYLYFNTAHADEMKRAYEIDIEIGMNVLDCIRSENDRGIAKLNFDRALRGDNHSNIRIFGNENKAYYESFFNPIINDKNEVIGATAIARDISERKKSELALLQSKEELKELNFTKDKIFSIIGHDLRNPFNNIIGLSDLLIESANDPAFSESVKYLEIISDTAIKTRLLLDHLLNWAKAQTGQLSFKPEKVNLSKIIIDVIDLEKPLTNTKNISLNFDGKAETKVYADVNMLKTILRNLISNAIKFTRNGGSICVFTKTKFEHAEVTISDNGIGIDKKRIEGLFKRNASTLGTANEEGSGLGLMLCKDFVEKNKGKIWVESVEGKGSDFKFTLPLNLPD